MNNEIAGDEKAVCGFDKLNRKGMKPVGLIGESKERRGVNEDGRAEGTTVELLIIYSDSLA